MSIVNSPIVGPIYSDTTEGFLLLFSELVRSYAKNIVKDVPFLLRIPSTKTPMITELMQKLGEIKKVNFFLLSFKLKNT